MTINVATIVGEQPSVTQRRLSRLLHNPLAVISALILIVLVVIAIIEPWILPFSPDHVDLNLTNQPPFTSEYLLGGDLSGRDILSRLIAGTRDAMIAAASLTVVALAIGVLMGLVAGFFGGILDSIANWLFSILLAVPAVLVLISLYTIFHTPTVVAIGVLGVLSSTQVFYLVRGLTRSVRNELYVDAARVSGVSIARIVMRHVLMVVKGPIIVIASFLAAGAVTVSAGLAFLGLGDPTVPNWGGTLHDAFSNYFIAPWQLLWPALAIGITTAAFVLLGSAIRDAFEGADPAANHHHRKPTTRPTTVSHVQAAESAPALGQPLLQVTDLHVAYQQEGQTKSVVSRVSFTVADAEIVGLVGESGSGKTQTVFATLGLLPRGAIVPHGSVRLNGIELLGLGEPQFAKYRVSGLAYVPQEPMSNLDPLFRVGSQLVEGIRAQSGAPRSEAKELAMSMLSRVGIRDPLKTFRSYPHQISGGMAQRVLIAGAIACKPKLLVADEPTTALDVTVQAEILDLLRDLQADYRMSILIVTHNFGVVADLCDRVIVMRKGEIVEGGPVRQIFTSPQHDYTRMLLASILDDAAPRPTVDRLRSAADA